ncbi:MAG TPA: hypothetical protein VHS58_03385 [Acetobacteraceae bacterium]|nr:hypothetical protein [Acetobacteraceae bacterium]
MPGTRPDSLVAMAAAGTLNPRVQSSFIGMKPPTPQPVRLRARRNWLPAMARYDRPDVPP